jgi:threonine synthase
MSRWRGAFCDCPGAEGGSVVVCPRRAEPGVDCVPVPERSEALAPVSDPAAEQPFLRYRERLWSCPPVDMVHRLDDAVADVSGRRLAVSPLVDATEVAAAAGRPGVRVVAKDETGQPAGSHKIRHLFGLALHLLVDDPDAHRRLAIASCGNAALAAATVARAAGWRLEVFVPPDAHPAVLAELDGLAAEIVTCPRGTPGGGDPCYHRFRQAVDAGALPFATQGPDNALTIDGGRTLGWELAEQAAAGGCVPQHLFVQVGGGALASSVAAGWRQAGPAPVRFHAVQTAGVSPLARAAAAVAARAAVHGVGPAMAWAVRHRSEVMWPWEAVAPSCATGILDDETYDWAAVVDAVLSSGGSFEEVDETALRRANGLVVDQLGIDADETGTAGVAGFLGRLPHLADGSTMAVLLTGARRD